MEGTNMIHLVTDSTAYLPTDIKQKYDVHTASLKVIVGDQTYDEEGGITKAEFFKLLANVATAPTTSQPSAGEFLELYTQLLGDEDEIISIHLSEGVSGTVPNARAAAREISPDRIHVVDSRTTAIGLMIMVIAAGEALAAGKSTAEILSILERMIDESCIYFSVDTLEYLHKGGRIGAASKWLGMLLNIKPVLYLHEGVIQPLDKVRTTKKARRRILDEVEQIVGQRPSYVAVAHIQAEEAAQELAERARERLNCASLYIAEVGPAVGSHVGPGTLALAACPVGEGGI
jgi:DegV family protein with EDD domain